ncbi:hypothetical protein KPH14_005216 [Odynerus spinipes]|uniref:Uncharacterized protein n=1 Tax=Odynerus spinipes TaxID=1348599 RepID=A0AAD9RDT8_9HYME|nr:hypothetical protein KPH14_005216 [Odynerus spinipes]
MNTLILICLICCVWPISGAEKDAYCFQYTWPGPMYANSSSVNCTSDKFKGVPCIAPIIVGSRPPNISYLWDKWDKETKLNPHLCTLQDGYACISYSYIYNNAVLNTSHYCGKIIEDKTVAITSGCFYYKGQNHVIQQQNRLRLL